ncbi:MAG: DUF1512 domain-containing protein [Candidatus Aenigmarchaeota archaeon]|nr:DUF1512 domain-containing protein [Candidatus Aenigmarchaeota archaeon]
MIGNLFDIYWIFFILFFFLFPIIYPRVVLAQALYFINSMIEKVSDSIERSKRKFIRIINPKVSSDKIFEKLDFITIEPTSLDPFGIVNKLEFILNQSSEKIESYIRKFSNEKDEEKLKNYKLLFEILIVKNIIKKILEHYREIIKKYRNLQIALFIQFQLPIIDRIFKSYENGFETVLNNLPIGDGIGPLVIANLISKEDKIKEIEECIVVKKKLFGKEVILIRAKGPGARLGRLHKALENVLKKEKNIDKIITIDAALKLEGEETGSIAEGIGVAIGGVGVEKFNIETIATRKKIRMEAIAIKMSSEEAIKIMNPKIYESVDKVIERLKELLEDSKKAIIIGVGNSVGVPNTKEELENLKEKVKDFWEKYGKEIEKRSWLDKLFGI